LRGPADGRGEPGAVRGAAAAFGAVGAAAGPNRGTPGLGAAGRVLDTNPHTRVRFVPRHLARDGHPMILLLQLGDGVLTARTTPVLGIDHAPSPVTRNATP
jgi:hypothetical protein